MKRDKAEGEEHRRGKARLAAPHCRQPAEHLGGGGNGNGDGGDGESRSGKGVEAGDEHVVSPNEDAEEADEERGGDHGAVGEDAATGEVAEQHRDETHAREDGDVDLRMAEEPEEMKPK